MSSPVIKFGTDGWRAVIADGFTFENVRIVSQAIADYVLRRGAQPQGMVIGYDNRFQGETFASIVAEVIVANGIPVCLAGEPLPTPVISFAARHYGLDGGIMITASHNPAEYSGIKFKTPDGASADPSITSQFEQLAGASPVRRVDLGTARRNDMVMDLALTKPYFSWISNFIDRKVLGRTAYTVVVDSMYGVGKRYIEEMLKDSPHTVATVRGERNPSFCGIAPEPIPANLAACAEAVRERHADVGLVTDGDADRIGALDNNGGYIITPKIATLIALHLIKNRGWKGSFVKTLSCSVVIDRFAREFNMPVIEKAVGFKNIVPYLMSHEALVGTEESGGLGIQNHIPERDGILGSLLFLEALVGLGFKHAAEAMAFLDKNYGALRYHRVDRHVDSAQKDAFMRRVASAPPTELLGSRVANIKTFDGVKFECADDSWLLLRFSGTEPLVRVYAEGPSQEHAEALTKLGEAMLA